MKKNRRGVLLLLSYELVSILASSTNSYSRTNVLRSYELLESSKLPGRLQTVNKIIMYDVVCTSRM
jgi:hypothetical protein